jgi:hypothetical protein
MKMKRTPIRGFLQDVSGFSDEQTLFFFARTPTPLHISMLYRYPFHARGTPVPHPQGKRIKLRLPLKVRKDNHHPIRL